MGASVHHLRGRVGPDGLSGRIAGVIALSVLGALGLAPAAAQAAFPGENGSIAYTHAVPCTAAPGTNYPPDDIEIFTLDPDGGETNVSNNDCPANGDFPSQDSEPAYSPDGSKIAFVRDNNNIFLMNADGSGKRLITEPGDGESDFGPSFSPLT